MSNHLSITAKQLGFRYAWLIGMFNDEDEAQLNSNKHSRIPYFNQLRLE